MHEKHDSSPPPCVDFTHSFYGSVTVGERGQIVIPAEARQQLDMNPGDKLLVMKHPLHKGLMVFKFDSVKEFIDDFSRAVSQLEERVGREAS